MTDKQIEKYLSDHNWSVNAQDCLMEVLNTSPQIIYKSYDFDNSMLTIITPDNTFTFTWELGNGK